MDWRSRITDLLGQVREAEVPREVLNVVLDADERVEFDVAFFQEKAGDGLSRACGTTWKQGELAYLCNTCGQDPTCAVCIPCFRDGDHENHDYAMIKTNGGCCDCGDIQAWARSGFCSQHVGTSTTSEDVSSAMPEDFKERLTFAVSEAAEKAIELGENGRTKDAEALLDWLASIARYGDGFRRVISVKLGEQPSRGGGTSEERNSLLRRLLRLQTAQRKQDSLDRILDALFFDLLVDFCFRSSLLREIVYTYESPSFARRTAQREDARHNSTDEYGVLQVSDSDDEESEDKFVLQHFSCQILTVPGLVPEMIQEGGILDVVIHTLSRMYNDSYRKFCSDNDLIDLETQRQEMRDLVLRQEQPFMDLNYLLRHQAVASHLVHKRKDLLREIVSILASLQSMGSMMRGVSRPPHTEDEKRIAALIPAECQMLAVVELLVTGFELNPPDAEDADASRKEALQIVFDPLCEWLVKTSIEDEPAPLPGQEKSPVLVLPLHRLFSLFMNALMRKQYEVKPIFQTLIGDVGSEEFSAQVLSLIRHPLLLKQAVSAGLSDGTRAIPKIFELWTSNWYRWVTDLDVNLLQFCLAATGPLQFEQAAFQCLMGQDGFSKKIWEDEKARRSLEHCMMFIMQVLLERTGTGYTNRDQIRHEVLHILFARDCSYSTIIEGVSKHGVLDIDGRQEFGETPQIIAEVVREVAGFRPPRGTSQGYFRVKDTEWRHYNLFNVLALPRSREESTIRFREVLGRRLKKGESSEMFNLTNLPLYEGLRGNLRVATSLCRAAGPVEQIMAEIRHSGESTKYLYLLLACVATARSAAELCERGDQFYDNLASEDSSLLASFVYLSKDKAQPLDVSNSLYLVGSYLSRRLGEDDEVVVSYMNCTGDGLVREDLLSSRKRKEMRLRKQEEIRDSFRRKQELFMQKIEEETPLPDEVKHLEMDVNELQISQDFSVDNHLKKSVNADHTCVVCHAHSRDDVSVIGLIGYAQVTQNLQRDSNLADADSFMNEIDFTNVLEDSANPVSSESPSPETAVLSEDLSPDGDAKSAAGQEEVGKMLSVPLINTGVGTRREVYVNFCGHYIHNTCLEVNIEFKTSSETNEQNIEVDDLTDQNLGEFLCPFCRRLANSFVPLIAPRAMRKSELRTTDFEEWKRFAEEKFKNSYRPAEKLPRYWRYGTDWITRNQVLPPNSNPFRNPLFLVVMPLIYKFAPAFFNEVRQSPSVPFWRTIEAVAVSIGVTELIYRSGNTPGPGSTVVVETMPQLLHSCRVQLSYLATNADVMAYLWEIISSGKGDPFGKLIHAVMLWPEELHRSDLMAMVKICNASESYGDSSISTLRRELVYLRRATVLLSYLTGDDLDLQAYNEENDAVPELKRLRSKYDIDEPLERGLPEKLTIYYPRLYKLPSMLQDLLEKLDANNRVRCRKCGKNSYQLALCLVCSRLISAPSACCGETNETNMSAGDLLITARNHARRCGAGIGVFLILQDVRAWGTDERRRHSFAGLSAILLSRAKRYAIWCSPFLDEHGEEDVGLSRGKPLHFSEDRYGVLEKLWLSAGFDYDSRIIESSHTLDFQNILYFVQQFLER
ncbi:hypothetical protein NDN08_000919 [Rhodosorus marinus]|uniref:E3 ubiquitin-protein ligase n=1 Tax=Rhodosorus marinus TaxID=101924 RepID=A0AAV8UPG3_9RHOD|nr:hypothetical protein NDN08_000919 [Rhodosorus marinus]